MARVMKSTDSSSLAEVVDRILDKGLVIAGDIKVSLAEVELLTIRIRLMICSIDKAEQIGMDWWRTDPRLSSRAQAAAIPPATHAASAEKQQESRHGS